MEVNKENLKINTVEENKNLGVYTFEPLPTGFGYTLANALRRVLLTSIKGAAVTQVKIKGATHQFSTLKGVKEDLIEITLNLKKLRIKMHSDNTVVALIKKKGEGEVTAKDIEISSEAEIMNKDLHIATLADSKTEFEAELIIEPGVGYSPMEDRDKANNKVGYITLDALYSPVKSVTYEIEPARFGERIDLDKMTLRVETDGSISPKESIAQAAEIVEEYYDAISKWESGKEATKEVVREDKKPKISEDIAIEELPLKTRTINALKKNGVDTMHQLIKLTDEEISDIKNLGEKSIEEIKKLIEKEGLR